MLAPKTLAVLLLLACGVTLGVSCRSQPSPSEPSRAAAAPSTGLAPSSPVEPSRFIFMPPVDDGTTSGRHAVTICLPAGYDGTDRRYPVIYVLDGDTAFFTRQHGVGDAIGYEVVHDQLVHDHVIDPAIFVSVHNAVDAAGRPVPASRGIDYYPTVVRAGAGGEAYFAYLATVIKPMIDRTYRTRPDAASTGVAGFSASGLGAFWMAYVHPEVFGMALCQSPDVRQVKRLLAEHEGPRPATRLWLDVGSLEIGIGLLDAAYNTSSALIAQGFRLNDDFAFHIGHGQGHEKYCCHQRLASALSFLLRKRAPALARAEIVAMNATAPGPIELTRVDKACVELVYDDGLRLVDTTASLSVADPGIVELGDVLNRLTPLAPGETTLTASTAAGRVEQRVRVPPPPPPFTCAAVTHPVVVDGDVSEWGDLPIVVDRPRDPRQLTAWSGPADLSYAFACAHDDQYLYVALRVVDDVRRSVADRDPWMQDGVEVRIDARPARERLVVAGMDERETVLLIAMSPSSAEEHRPPFHAESLPPGTLAICRATPTGHDSEIAIPMAWLDQQAGGRWSDLRLNVAVDDLDDDPVGFRGDQLWWQGDWRTPDNVAGSGVFVRAPAP